MQIIARVGVDNRTRTLVKGLQGVGDVKLLTTRVEELSFHLLEFPETRAAAVKVVVVVVVVLILQTLLLNQLPSDYCHVRCADVTL